MNDKKENFLDLDKDGQQWINNPPEDNMEWIASVIPIVRSTTNKKGINVRGVYDQVYSFYSDQSNLSVSLKEVLSKAITDNEIR
jgi:hypothetical protein